jgi:hypothetical protein
MQVMRWTASKSRDGNVELIRLFQGRNRLSFRELFGLLLADPEFAAWYTELLGDSHFDAFFWEHPPLTLAGFGQQAEFVMIDAPTLAGLAADDGPFRAYFTGQDVVTFQNLSADATLIAPCPGDSQADYKEGYAHLAAFLRQAPASKVTALWHSVSQAVSASLSDEPLWLSTSGLGVAWLHVRLGSTPKYYQHRPYRSRDVA